MRGCQLTASVLQITPPSSDLTRQLESQLERQNPPPHPPVIYSFDDRTNEAHYSTRLALGKDPKTISILQCFPALSIAVLTCASER